MDVTFLSRLQFGLTIYNASSSPKTLWIIIAVVGLPFVLAYIIAVYWTFRGKVGISDHSH